MAPLKLLKLQIRRSLPRKLRKAVKITSVHQGPPKNYETAKMAKLTIIRKNVDSN